MTKIDGTNNVNNNIKINLNKINQPAAQKVNSTFGEGFAKEQTFLDTESRFQALTAKFDFEMPKYPKGGFSQFNPTDSDYEKMKYLDAILDKPEASYCEV